ncbi:MAG: hypothetical protein WC749_14015 [Dehalococcoidia bacterium]
MADRFFTEEELKEMGARTLDLLTEAIESGDSGKAKSLANRMHKESEFMHDLYMNWIADLMSYIHTNLGTDSTYQAVRKICNTAQGELIDVRKIDFKLRVKGLLHALRGHLQPIKIEEDDEKVCLTMEPCGSGQRLVQQGAYDPPRNCTMIAQPHPMTYGLTDVPIYCTHEPVLEILAIEKLGYPAVVAVPAEKMGRAACKFCIYKNVEDIPEEFYTRLGKQKPKRKEG